MKSSASKSSRHSEKVKDYNSHSFSTVGTSSSEKSTKSRKKQDTLYSEIDITNARHDLMSLGIEIDENLIQRLQSLGIEKIFSSATQTAELLKSRRSVPDGVVPEISYRNVNEDSDKNQSRPWQSQSLTFQVDIQRIMTILQQIGDAQGKIDPSTRNAIEKGVQQFRIRYSRAPDRFVRCMLGLPYSKTIAGNDDIQRLILKTRYVSEKTFLEMIRRLSNEMTPSQIASMFDLLAEDKSFGENKTRIVDLWLFLTLLKTASDESRRSYDCKTSKLASDVEFWYKHNNDGRNFLDDSKARVPLHKDLLLLHKKTSDLETIAHMRYLHDSSMNKDFKNRDSVASLLGVRENIPAGVVNHGRGVTGTFTTEETNMCTVPSALHSPIRYKTTDIKMRKDPEYKKDWSFLNSNDMSDRHVASINGIGVAAALGGQVHVLSSHEPRDFRISSHILQRENSNKTTVAFAMGCGREDVRGRMHVHVPGIVPVPLTVSTGAFGGGKAQSKVQYAHYNTSVGSYSEEYKGEDTVFGKSLASFLQNKISGDC